MFKKFRAATAKTALIACATLLTAGLAQAQILAFADGGTGNQAFTGNLGNDFTVNSSVIVTALCAFNATGVGFAAGTTINVGIFTNPGGALVVGPQTFTGTNGTLVGKDRCITLGTPVVLAPGNYSVVAVGFNRTDLNGNSTLPGFVQTTNSGGGLLSFPGTGRFDVNTTLDFPLTTGAFTFSAGSFQFVAVAAPTITKAFAPATIDINGVSTLTFTIANSNAIPLTNVSFNDTLPAGVVIATPNGLTGTCGGGTITATAGTSLITLTGATLAASASCTFSVNVTGLTFGTKVNTTSTVTSTEAPAGTAATANLVVLPVITDDGSYQLRYLANLNQGDSYVNLTNAGTLAGFDPAGRICVNVYTFDPNEELISCCACPVTPNGLNSLSARNDLISNTLTPGVPTSITVKLVATTPLPGGVCNASSPSAGVGNGFPTPANLVRGMRAWATTIHLNTALPPSSYQETETPFSRANLSLSELTKLTSFCSFIQSNGSGFGICKSCRVGALGADQK